MATTTNYSWTTPDDTDLVKDGAAAIRSLGSAIDSTVFTNAGNAINKTIVDAKGDLIAATAADTVARLASSGVNNDVLTVDTSTATGLKWAAPASGSTNWALLNTGGTALTGAATITVSGISAKELLILVSSASADAASVINLQFNSDTAANYTNFGVFDTLSSTYAADNLSRINAYSTSTAVLLGKLSSNSSASIGSAVFVDLTDKSGWKRYAVTSGLDSFGGNNGVRYISQGFYEGSAAITSVSITSSVGNFDAGTIYVLGAN